MSSLTPKEKKTLERLFRMSEGYVLNFSNATFSQFMLDQANIDIYGSKYEGGGDSKAKRLRTFWSVASDHVVGAIMLAMIDYSQGIEAYHNTDCAEECRAIANRLVGEIPNNQPLKEIAAQFETVHLPHRVTRMDEAKESGPDLAIGTGKDTIGGCVTIDPIISLALGVHSQKGVYALLLGSGVSRTAGIPTGWEIMKELIRKVAVIRKFDCGTNPIAWYAQEYKTQPSYDTLLTALTNSPSERASLLRPYFEPTDEERRAGRKVPTAAHKAIARLVRDGYIRVLITTNFDRLLEKAIEEVGIVPIVLSTPDAINGALPVAHSHCVVFKLHGDYLDTRIKNTPLELGHYENNVNAWLDQVFAEHGLIVCGWSADYDTALRSALERRPSGRFPCYWAVKGELGEAARRLTTQLSAQMITIENADAFFTELEDKVHSLQDSSMPDPLSAQSSVIKLKGYLVDNRHRIQLEELMLAETEQLHARLADTTTFPVSYSLNTADSLVRMTDQYRELASTLVQLISVGCQWGEPDQAHIWRRCVERIANNPTMPWRYLKLYPALLLLYAGGIVAVNSGRYHNLYALLRKAVLRENRKEVSVCEEVHTYSVFNGTLANNFPGLERHYTAASDHLYAVLRPILTDLLPSQPEYERAFDRLEILWALANIELSMANADNPLYKARPFGSFLWRYGNSYEQSLLRAISDEAHTMGQSWGPLKAGFFRGDLGFFDKVAEQFWTVIEPISAHFG